jgi:hypothetical protein
MAGKVVVEAWIAALTRDITAHIAIVRADERERCAKIVCIGCARGVERVPPSDAMTVWTHVAYPWRCDASALLALTEDR